MAGIAAALPLPEAAAYERWLKNGMQAGMDYMSRNAESRRDIAHWYPQAKSVLLCGFSYASPPTPQPPSTAAGRVSRYAVAPDYHKELRRKLKIILAWLKTEQSGADGRFFVDTSPLLERLYARYAGLGWVGKNTMLISPGLGSYFFLGGIALNLELPPDQPVTDHCGSCTRCLDACPTDAFPSERVLDSNRCIAYYTVEHRGPIPEEFRPGIGDWIMGCDICQEVCPFNRFSRPGSVFKPVMDTQIPLEELSGTDEASFKDRFGKTPFSRPKRRGILRNALLAMGNSKDPRFRPILERRAQDPDPVISEQASWSLQAIDKPAFSSHNTILNSQSAERRSRNTPSKC